MVEGYNALVHILKGLNGGKTTLDNNILKASNHFHRGALDYYKAIIKENFDKIDKENFKELRIEEFESIGLETNKNSNKNNIVDKYEKKVKKIIK